MLGDGADTCGAEGGRAGGGDGHDGRGGDADAGGRGGGCDAGYGSIARVGYTQKRAEGEGLAIEVVKSQYSANIIARAELLGPGFVKAVFHQDKIIGAVVVGDHAAEILAPLALAVGSGLTRKQLKSWVIDPKKNQAF